MEDIPIRFLSLATRSYVRSEHVSSPFSSGVGNSHRPAPSGARRRSSGSYGCAAAACPLPTPLQRAVYTTWQRRPSRDQSGENMTDQDDAH